MANGEVVKIRSTAIESDTLNALEMAVDLIKIARGYFPKSIRNSDKFALENTNAALIAAIAKIHSEASFSAHGHGRREEMR